MGLKPREFWISLQDDDCLDSIYESDPSDSNIITTYDPDGVDDEREVIHVIEHSHHTKLIEAKDAEIEALKLQTENLSMVIRRMSRWVANREPKQTCEKVLYLSRQASHLLTPVSVFRSEALKEQG